MVRSLKAVKVLTNTIYWLGQAQPVFPEDGAGRASPPSWRVNGSSPFWLLLRPAQVKVAGIMVSEEGGAGGINNWGAIEMAHDGANWGQQAGGTFDIRKWIGGGYQPRKKTGENGTSA